MNKKLRLAVTFFMAMAIMATLLISGTTSASASTSLANANGLTVSNVTASSSLTWTSWPQLVVDGDYETGWSASTDSQPQWLQLDLGTVSTVRAVRTFWFNPTSTTYTYNIQVSTDGTNWTTVVGSRKSKANLYTDTIFASTSARYVQINITASTNNSIDAIDEVQVYNRIPAPWAGVPAEKVTDFLNSLGVGTHFGQESPGYTPADVPNVAQALNYIGFRHVRDGDNLSLALPNLIQLHQQSGVTADVNLNGSVHCQSGQQTDPNALLNTARQLQANHALLSIEGPNEANNWPILYQGTTCSENDYTVLARYMRDLYSLEKSDPVLKSYPVFQTSGAGPGAEVNNAGLQFLTIPQGAGTLMPDGTQMADYANMHNYVWATNTLRDNEAWNMSSPLWHGNDYGSQGGYGDPLFGESGSTWRNHYQGYSPMALLTLPRVTTETGWATQGTNSISEAQQGNLYLNLVLDQFKNGYTNTFLYQLMDQDQDGAAFGLVRKDWSYKPSAVYLHNLTTILADSGKLAVPGSVPYSIPNEPSTTHSLLLQKSNGNFELAVWGENTSGADTVTVNLGGEHTSVKVYDPTAGTNPVQTLSNVRSVPLTLSPHPFILEFQHRM